MNIFETFEKKLAKLDLCEFWEKNANPIGYFDVSINRRGQLILNVSILKDAEYNGLYMHTLLDMPDDYPASTYIGSSAAPKSTVKKRNLSHIRNISGRNQCESTAEHYKALLKQLGKKRVRVLITAVDMSSARSSILGLEKRMIQWFKPMLNVENNR